MSSADQDETLPSLEQLLSETPWDEFPEMPPMWMGSFPEENHLETQPSHQEDAGNAARTGVPRAPEPLLSPTSGDPKARASQVSGSSLLLTGAQGDVKPRVSPPFGDQEPLLHPPRKERKQPLPEADCCPHCPVFLKDIEHLKVQLDTMESLMEKFMML